MKQCLYLTCLLLGLFLNIWYVCFIRNEKKKTLSFLTENKNIKKQNKTKQKNHRALLVDNSRVIFLGFNAVFSLFRGR